VTVVLRGANSENAQSPSQPEQKGAVEGAAGQGGGVASPAASESADSNSLPRPGADIVLPTSGETLGESTAKSTGIVASLDSPRKRAEIEPESTASAPLAVARTQPTPVQDSGLTNTGEKNADRPASPDIARSGNVEPAAPEKPAAASVKTVALELTPDGAHGVRVRLSERGSDVHITLHSSDPATAKSLRESAPELASVLSRSGYDAHTWTAGKQHQGNSQQQQTSQRRRDKSTTDEEGFAGVYDGAGITKISQEIQ